MTKILALADLHLHKSFQDQVIRKVKKIIQKQGIDLVAIAGDCFNNPKQQNPYKKLAQLGKPVVFCLGNHDFSFLSVPETTKYYNDMKAESTDCDVHCLDIDGHYVFNGINFTGNVLWYDGSMRDYRGQGDEIIQGWLDSTIKDFDYKAENEKCIAQINDKLNHPQGIQHQFLLTHCVPHFGLNAHSSFYSIINSPSQYNMYSGVKDLFPKLSFHPDYAVCGHTHKKMACQINGTKCINVGNDYYFHTKNIVYNVIQVA